MTNYKKHYRDSKGEIAALREIIQRQENHIKYLESEVSSKNRENEKLEQAILLERGPYLEG